MKRLRIAMIAPPWLPIPPSGYGGIENVLYGLVPELMKLGAEVELFTVGDTIITANKNHHLFSTGQYEHIHKPHYDAGPIAAAHVLFTMHKILQDGTFDVVHDHNNTFGPLAYAFATPKFPPVIHTLHNPRFVASDGDDSGLEKTPVWEQLRAARRLYFVCISGAMQKSAPPALKKLLLPYVHNGIDVSQFPFVSEKSDYFITMARFHPEKGEAIAVEVCEELGYKLKMAGVVGDIATKRKLMLELANPLSRYRSLEDFRYFSDKIFPYVDDGFIEYVGQISGEAKTAFMSEARALLFPIQWEEPFGMAPIEALACGTPVVAMARGALPEIIQHGKNGFLAKNKAEFKQYVKRVSEINPADCRASVEQHFSAASMAKTYLERYKQAIVRAKRQKN